MTRLRILQEHNLVDVKNGIDRYSAIIAFNESFYQLRDQTPSILSDVAYVSRTGRGDTLCETDPIAKLVINHLVNTDWVKCYGLSYEATMNLTYAKWVRMQKVLNNKPQIPMQQQLVELAARLTALVGVR